MALLVPNNGEGDMLAYMLNKITPEGLVLKLFVNDITPSETDTAASYTEASGNGYANVALTGSLWTITEGSPSNASYPEQSFLFTGDAGNVYGYFLVRAGSGRIAWAERFSDGPYDIVSGDTIKITPTLTLD